MSQLKSQETKKSSDDTATRILDAAEVLFAENGFGGTSARDITSSAECNVASINYYFGGKDNLYRQVCKRRLNALRDIRINSINDYMAQSSDKITLEGLLNNFSEAFLAPFIEMSFGRNVMRLMVREMLYPQLPANMIYDELLLPVCGTLQEAILKVCPELEAQQALWSIFSLIGQLFHTMNVNGIMENYPDERFAPGFDIKGSVEHIVAFTTAGIMAMIKKNGED